MALVSFLDCSNIVKGFDDSVDALDRWRLSKLVSLPGLDAGRLRLRGWLLGIKIETTFQVYVSSEQLDHLYLRSFLNIYRVYPKRVKNLQPPKLPL